VRASGPAQPALHPDAETPRQGAGGRDDHRAATKVRRIAAANGLGRLLTLTFAKEPESIAELNGLYRNFRRRARRRLPRVAMLKVNERGKLNGRVHMHVGVSHYVPKVVWEELWRHGFVKVTFKTRDPRKSGRYLAKYVSKDPVRVPGGHRYEVDEGLQPGEWTVELPYAPHIALGVVLDALGVQPERAWLSTQIEGWTGPPSAGALWPLLERVKARAPRHEVVTVGRSGEWS
jgi:hypothetical protein